ncbi:MAG: toprim domain-containing protein, partial [Nitrospiria bacterium]
PHRKYFQDEFINQKGYTIEQLKQSGLLAWRFGVNYQLVFPVRDEHGKIVSWAGRLTMPGKDKEGGDLPKYKNTFGLHKNLPYNFSRAKRAIERTKRVIIVEGFMDAAHCFAKGFENVVAILGARLLPDQLNHLVLAGATQILMCLDRDKDGEAGTEQAFELFANHPKLQPYFVYLPPDCKDADELLRKKSRDNFEELLSHAQPGWMWYANRISKEYDDTPDRDALLNKYAAIYEKILDPISKNEFVKELAENTGIGILDLRRKFSLVEVSGSMNKKEIDLDKYSASLDGVAQILLKSTNFMEIKKYFKKTSETTYVAPRDPVGKRIKHFLKKTGPAFLLIDDIEGLKNELSELNNLISDAKNKNINRLKTLRRQ